MDEIKARFEFRAWARNFGMVETRLRGFSKCEGIRESDEIYIVAANKDGDNIKIRNDELNIKEIVQERDGLEQWRPRLKGPFPMTAEVLKADVFPCFGVTMPTLDRSAYTVDQFLDEVVRPNRDLVTVNVFKRRFAFTVSDCITEHAEVWFNGAGLQTVAVESTDVEAVLETKRQLGLGDYENVNYLCAIKRVIGLEPAPQSF